MAEWGELFNGADRPSIRNVTEETVVRVRPQAMLPFARTQETRPFRLDSRLVSKTNRCERMMGSSHVGVSLRVLSTMTSNTSFTVTLSSLKLSAPEIAAAV